MVELQNRVFAVRAPQPQTREPPDLHAIHVILRRVDLRDDDLVRVSADFLGELGVDGVELFAVATPGRVKLHEHILRRVHHHIIKRRA